MEPIARERWHMLCIRRQLIKYRVYKYWRACNPYLDFLCKQWKEEKEGIMFNFGYNGWNCIWKKMDVQLVISMKSCFPMKEMDIELILMYASQRFLEQLAVLAYLLGQMKAMGWISVKVKLVIHLSTMYGRMCGLPKLRVVQWGPQWPL